MGRGARWRVELIAPRQAEGFWISAQELARHLEFSRATLKLNAPARKVPKLVPVKGLQLPRGDGWSTTHKLVGLSVLVHLSTTSARALAARTGLGPAAKKARGAQCPAHTVMIEAVLTGCSLECWGRV